MTAAATPQEESDLCASCGMCCNGVMFYLVPILPDESPKALLSAGLKLTSKKGKYGIAQPCPAFCGTHCSIYDLRPQRCRAFECRQLMRLKSGEIDHAAAFAATAQLREQVEDVTRLLELLGSRNSKRSLSQRYALVMGQALDGGWEGGAVTLRSELEAAMARLVANLEANFYTHKRGRVE